MKNREEGNCSEKGDIHDHDEKVIILVRSLLQGQKREQEKVLSQAKKIGNG